MSEPRSRPVSDCRRDFPSLTATHRGRPLAYLDGPAGTQVPRQVADAITHYYETANANTEGQFPTSRATDATIAAARSAAAAFLGAPSGRTISFGQNMTSLAFALSHAFGRLFGAGDEVVVTALDHEANRGPWLALAERGVVVREVGLRRDGRLEADDLERMIGPRTRLVAIGWASNALGTVNDIALARRLSRQAGAWLLVDAVHYAPHFPIDVGELEPDFLLCSAYKFYGPHVGLLYSRPGLLEELPCDRLRPQHPEAPDRIETGTLNHAALAGVTAAVDYIASWGVGGDLRSRVVSAMEAMGAWEEELARTYWENVREIPGVTVWGPPFGAGPRAPTVSITVEGLHPTELARHLGERGLQVWDGDFYAARPVEVLGLAERGGLLRTGISMYNTREEVDRLLEGIAEIARGRR